MRPKNWEIKKLIDVADSKTKWSFTGGPFGSNLKASDYTDEGVRIIQLQNIGDGEFLDGYKIYTSEKKANELVSCNIYPNEIILSKMGDPVARACKIPPTEKRFVMSSDGIRLKVDTKEFNLDFVLNYINHDSFRNIALEKAIGSTRKRIGLDDLKNIPFPKPSLNEQNKIAEILNTCDFAIEKTTKLISKKEKKKKALMQDLLTGKLRFKEFKKDKWKIIRFGNLGETFSGLSGKSANDFGEGDYYIPYMNIFSNNRIDQNNLQRVTIHENEKQNKVQYGDVFFTVSSETPHEVGMSSVLLDEIKNCYLNSFCFGFRLKDFKTVTPEFLRFYLRAEFCRREISQLAQGSTRFNLSKGQLLEIKMKFPPTVKEQQKIATFLSSIDDEIQKLKTQLQIAKKQKKGLMQLLLTGKLRVKI